MRVDWGEAPLVDAAVPGKRRPPLGECGLCEGVEGRDRDLVEVGESFEDCASAMFVPGLSLLDIFFNLEVSIAVSIKVRSSSVAEVMGIENCLLGMGESRTCQIRNPAKVTALSLYMEH